MCVRETERAGGGRRSFSNLIFAERGAEGDKRRKERCPSLATGKGRLEQSLVSGVQVCNPSQSHCEYIRPDSSLTPLL